VTWANGYLEFPFLAQSGTWDRSDLDTTAMQLQCNCNATVMYL